jgi:hypothetical protein
LFFKNNIGGIDMDMNIDTELSEATLALMDTYVKNYRPAHAPTDTSCLNLDAGLGLFATEQENEVYQKILDIYHSNDPYFNSFSFDNLNLAWSNATMCPDGLDGFQADLERIVRKEIAPDKIKDFVSGMIDKYCS